MHLKVEPFFVKIRYNGKNYSLKVIQVYVDERIEHFRIGSDRKHMLIQTDRPFWRKRGLKKRKPRIDFLTKGFYHGNHLEQLVKAIIEHADSITIPPSV